MTLLKFDNLTATYSNFTWNQISANSNCPKMLFLAILEVLNFDFSKFEQLSSSKFTKNSKFRVSKITKSCSKIIKFQQSQALTSHFESYWSIVSSMYSDNTNVISYNKYAQCDDTFYPKEHSSICDWYVAHQLSYLSQWTTF